MAPSGILELFGTIPSSNGRLAPVRASASVPRGDVALESILELGIGLSGDSYIQTGIQYSQIGTASPYTEYQETSNSTIQDEVSPEDEPGYVTRPQASQPPELFFKECKPTLAEWDVSKDQIKYWYIVKDYTCEKTKRKMANEGGFHASTSMYKRKIAKWAQEDSSWAKYKKGAVAGKNGRKLRSMPASSPEQNQDANLNLTTRCGSTTRVNRITLRAMSRTETDTLFNDLLLNVRELYISYLSQKKWKVANEREVEEDIHDDLLVGVANSLRNFDSLGEPWSHIGFEEMKQAFIVLEKVVGIRSDCGLFSLPSIWESFLRMIRKGKPGFAKCFLAQAAELAKTRFGSNHFFTRVLLILSRINPQNPQHLPEIILRVYRLCIVQVEIVLDRFHLTTLSLWGDFHVYLHGSSTNEILARVDLIRQRIQESEAKNGPDHEYTLELLGLTLYILQSDESDPRLAIEAEYVALDMLRRVAQIRANAGGKLEGDLIIMKKDLNHTLGTLKQNKEEYGKAIEYLEEFYHNEVEDGRDTLALQKLEECYISLGETEKAKKVQRKRLETTEILLWQNEVGTPDFDDSCSKEPEPANSLNDESSEGTAVNDYE